MGSRFLKVSLAMAAFLTALPATARIAPEIAIPYRPECLMDGFALTKCYVPHDDVPPPPSEPTPPGPEVVFTGPSTTDSLPVNFYLMCRDTALTECAKLPGGTTPSSAANVMAFLNRHMNFDGAVPNLSLSTHRRGFHLGKVVKVYAPDYYNISGSLDNSLAPSSDPALPGEGHAINAYIAASAPYCGKALVGMRWKTPQGARLTLDELCLQVAPAQEVIEQNGVRSVASTVLGDDSLSHEIMHLMGSSHTADFWGGRGTGRGCNKIYTWRVRKVFEEYRPREGLNVMSYDNLPFASNDTDVNGDGVTEQRLTTGFQNETLALQEFNFWSGWVTRNRPAGEVMGFLRSCYLKR